MLWPVASRRHSYFRNDYECFFCEELFLKNTVVVDEDKVDRSVRS